MTWLRRFLDYGVARPKFFRRDFRKKVHFIDGPRRGETRVCDGGLYLVEIYNTGRGIKECRYYWDTIYPNAEVWFARHDPNCAVPQLSAHAGWR